MNYPLPQGYPAQQPAYPPQYPQAPAPQGYPPQQYAPQPYPQQYQAPQPQVPLAQGTLDDYFNQPSAGGGPSISWSVNGMPKPDGTTYIGVVSRDVTQADIQQQTDPKTGQPKFYRDGRPQFLMKVPLTVQPTQEFPDGEAVLFVRGQMRDEMVRAMTEIGLPGNTSPRTGDVIQVTLVQRRPSRGGGQPMNVFAIRYQSVHAGQVAQPVVPAPPVPTAPSPAVGPEQVQVHYQQQPVQQPQVQQYQIQQPPVAPPYAAPVAQVPAPVPVPQAAPVAAPVLPSDLSAEQQALLARLTGGQG